MSLITVDSRYLMIVEIEDIDVSIQIRDFYKKDDDGNLTNELDRRFYYQVALLRKGRQNIEVQIPLKEGQPPYPVGEYLYHPNSFSVNKYGKLEMAYEQIIVPLPEQKKQ